MDWYYAKDNAQQGPVTGTALETLVAERVVTAETLVWHGGMADWLPYGEAVAPAEGGAETPSYSAEATRSCAVCGKSYFPGEMVAYENKHICVVCKPVFFQSLREGGKVPNNIRYGGFWIRVLAIIIDTLIVRIPKVLIAVLLYGDMGFYLNFDSKVINTPAEYILLGFMVFALPLMYSTCFVGRFAATPGRMMLGLKIVRPGGERITYLRAFCRNLAENLSIIILGIGFIMAAFDDEKRMLHDRICDTRVVYK